MKKNFTYNFVEKAIIGSRAAINRANKGMSPEYSELTKRLKAHPDFVVREKLIDKKEGKKTYKKLTLKRMEEYISLQDNSETKLIEFSAIQKVAEAKGAKYPLTKKWFLATYAEYKDSNLAEADTEDESEEAA